MVLKTFYNEIDPFCCKWISNLMDAGVISGGVICDKSIEDLTPDDVRGYQRAHFFAGISVWDYALISAGWANYEREHPGLTTWTGSCPCQCFSTAGKGAGFADKRHLFPSWLKLIKVCKPSVIFGEQVTAAIKYGWFDAVKSGLNAAGYAVAASGLSAAGFGAPHIRQRLYFVAETL